MSRLDGWPTRGRLTGSPERVSGVKLFQVLCQSLGPMQIRRGPPPTCSPLQTADRRLCSSDPTPPPTRPPPTCKSPTRLPVISQQQSPNPPLHHRQNSSRCLVLVLTLELGALAQALALGPGLGPGLGQTQDWHCQHRPVAVKVHSISIRIRLGHQLRRLLPANRDHPAVAEHHGSA